jgi:multidrug efflux pump
MVFLFLRLPNRLPPDEDQGFIICQLQLPAGATQERTLQVIRQIEKHFLEKEKKTWWRPSSPLPVSVSPAAARTWGWPCEAQGLEAARRQGAEGAGRGGAGHEGFSTIRDGLVFAFSPRR